MEVKEFLEIVKRAGKLKTNTRHCYTEEHRKESVADHSWRIALMAMLLSGQEEFADRDMNRVIRMCLIHDLGEAFTGDIPSFEKKETDSKREEDIFYKWIQSFPEPQKREWLSLLEEMKAMESKEAKTYKALDKLEAVISHDESDISSWLPLEYDLQLSYAQKNVAFSSYLSEVSEAVNVWTRNKIAKSKTGRDKI